MKRVFILSMCLLATFVAFSQKPSAESIRKRFSLGTTVFTDFWQKVPDSVNNRTINQGADVFVTYSFPMDKNDHIFFFAGAGLGAHNFYSKSQLNLASDNSSYFDDFPSTANGHSVTVKKSKLSITYFDIPFGFQYKATNKIHATLGFKVGWSINDHTKYKGTDYTSTSTGRTVRLKESSLPNIQNIHYGPFLTVGYKWFGLTASYQITSVFEKDLGPQIYPISVGVTFKPF